MARSPSGPRNDVKLPKHGRESYDNMILLCPTCHVRVDSDPHLWSAERLTRLKARHEARILGLAPAPIDKLPPARCRRLYGREELLEGLVGQIAGADPRHIVVLCAFGGYGKTEVARRVSEALLRDGAFEDAVWVGLKREEFSFTSSRNVPPRQEQVSTHAVLDEVAERLSCASVEELSDRLRSEAILVVIDNLETMPPDSRESLVSALHNLLGRGPSRGVVTSRIDLNLPYVQRPLFPGLSFTASAQLLIDEANSRSRKSTFDFARPGLLESIWELTNGMPLALHMVVGQAERYSLDRVISNLEEARAPGPDEDFYRFLFQQAWNELGPAARGVLAYMGSATRSPQTLYQLEGIRPTAEIALIGEDLGCALAELLKWFLVERLDPWLVSGEVAYDLHPLTRAFILSEGLRAKWDKDFGEEHLMDQAAQKHEEIFTRSLTQKDV